MKANISKLIKDSNRIDDFIAKNVKGKNDIILNTNSESGKWSPIEVIQHLNLVFELYFPRIDEAVSKIEPTLLDSEIVEAQHIKWSAGLMANMMKPKGVKRKYKMNTFDFFQPEVNEAQTNETIDRYLRNRAHFNQLIKSCHNKYTQKVTVTSAIKLLKFTIPEAVVWLLAHEQRHMVQLEEALAHSSNISE